MVDRLISLINDTVNRFIYIEHGANTASNKAVAVAFGANVINSLVNVFTISSYIQSSICLHMNDELKSLAVQNLDQNLHLVKETLLDLRRYLINLED